MTLRIAICQFPVDEDVQRNAGFIMRKMTKAARQGAEIVHFSECALGGYAGHNFDDFRNYDWKLVEQYMQEIMDLARRLRLWVIVGSNHRLTGGHKPHNCLYLISERGKIADRYDKMFCMGAEGKLDLRHYTPGSRFVVFSLRRVKCGLLICHDWRYPELYRQYWKRGVKIIFQSWYDGDLPQGTFKQSGQAHGRVIRATVQGHAACNGLWICGSNTSRPQSCFGSFVVQPDGIIARKAPRNRPHVLIHEIDTGRRFDDPGRFWRERAMTGVFHSGTIVNDPRSEDRKCLH